MAIEYNFHNEEIKKAYQEVRVVMDTPLYNSKTINDDFFQVEEFLRQKRVTPFGVSITDNLMLFWNGECLSRYDSFNKKQLSSSEMTDADRAVWHKHLPEVLREAKEAYNTFLDESR